MIIIAEPSADNGLGAAIYLRKLMRTKPTYCLATTIDSRYARISYQPALRLTVLH